MRSIHAYKPVSAIYITFATVGFQAVKAALANPIGSLRYE